MNIKKYLRIWVVKHLLFLSSSNIIFMSYSLKQTIHHVKLIKALSRYAKELNLSSKPKFAIQYVQVFADFLWHKLLKWAKGIQTYCTLLFLTGCSPCLRLKALQLPKDHRYHSALAAQRRGRLLLSSEMTQSSSYSELL